MPCIFPLKHLPLACTYSNAAVFQGRNALYLQLPIQAVATEQASSGRQLASLQDWHARVLKVVGAAAACCADVRIADHISHLTRDVRCCPSRAT